MRSPPALWVCWVSTPRIGAVGGPVQRVANPEPISAGAGRRRRRVTPPFFLERSPIGSVVVCEGPPPAQAPA